MPTLPPIPQESWDDHVTAQTDAAVQDGFSAIDQARQAQDAARQAEQIAQAREQEESYQSAQTQLSAVLAPAKDAQSRVQVAEQTRSQLDSILGPARAAQQQAQQAPARPLGGPPASGVTSAPAPTDVQGTDWRAYAAQAAQKAGIDPALFQRQIQQESNFDPNAKSGAGALGIAQIVPSAHPGVNPLDPKAALDYAATWMRQLTDRYGGDARKALAAYNAGPGAVDKYGGVPPFEETQRYVRTIYDDAGQQAGVLGPEAQPSAEKRTFPSQRAEAVGQFEQGLPYDEAAAICGPVAALAFAQSQGRNPDLAEARALAKQVGWTSTGGMNGVANEQALLTRLGVKSRLDTNPDFGVIAHDASSGNPVIISTPVHYYYASGYDPNTGKVFVGKTGTSRRGGGSWMTPQEISTLDGGINGALFVDNPQSPTPSVGASDNPSDNSDNPFDGDRPPSEFEQPPPEEIPRRLGPESIAPTDLQGISGEAEPLRPDLARVSRGAPSPSDVLAATDVPNRVGFAAAHALLTGRDPAQAILETARPGGEQPSGETLLADAGMPAGDARRVAGEYLDAGLDWRNVVPGLAAGGKGAVGRTLFAEPVGQVVGQEAGGAIGERIGGERGRAIGETIGSQAGGIAAGHRFQQIVEDPATYRLGITPEGGDTPARRVPVWMRTNDTPPPLEGFRPPEPSMRADVPAAPLPSGRSPAGAGNLRAPLVVESPLQPLERALARPHASAAERIKAGADRLIREAYDRNYPLRELDDLAGNTATTGAHAAAQVVSGAMAAGEDVLRRRVLPVLDGLGSGVRDLERYWVLKASEDVAARNPASKLPGGIEGPGGVQRGLAALKAQIGPERFARAEDALRQLTRVNVEERLQPLLDEGIIDRATFRDLRTANPHYLPFQRYDYAVDDPSHLLPRGPTSLSVSGAGLGKRTAGGSTLALDDPVARWMADLINVRQVVARNRAARTIVDGLRAAEGATGERLVAVADQSPAAASGLSRTTQERGVIRFFDPSRPGVQQVANVPDVYATVAKGLEAEPANAFMRLMNAAAAPLRLGATTLSLSFLPRNVVRDLQSVYTKEGIKPWSPEMLAGWKAAVARNTDFSEAAAAGALQSGLLESRRTADVLARARAVRGGITVSTPRDAVLLLPRLLGKAVSPIMRANEIAEQAPRLATFIKARGEGASPLEAAVRARDVTVDFSKSGNFVRMMNQMVPFLNARIQGTANTARLFAANPAQAAARVVAPAAFLSMAAFLWNQRYASSASIPENEWDRNWIFVFGEGTQNPDPRTPDKPPDRFPLYVKIPKGDAASIASAPVEAMLRTAFAQDDRSAVEHFLHAASAATRGLSPVEPTAGGLLGVVTPPVAATGSAIQSNYDPFRQRPIVPDAERDKPPEEQYGADTSSAAVALGRRFGVSPRMIDYAIKSYTGGAGGQGLWMADLALGALGYDPTAPGEYRQRQRTPAEAVARVPGVSGVIGAANTEQRAAGRDHFQQAVLETQRAFNETPDARRLGVSFGPVSDAIDRVVLEPQERIDYQRRSAEIAAELVDRVQGSGTYARADDDRKRKILQDTLEQARKRAAAEILRDIPPADRRERRRAS